MSECKVIVSPMDETLSTDGGLAGFVERAVVRTLDDACIEHDGVVVEFRANDGFKRFQDGLGTWDVPSNDCCLQDRAAQWHMARFPDAYRELVVMKGCEEMGEVASALNGEIGHNSATSDGDVVAEAADVLITMLVLVGRWYPERDLLAEVQKKLKVLNDPKSGHKSRLVSSP